VKINFVTHGGTLPEQDHEKTTTILEGQHQDLEGLLLVEAVKATEKDRSSCNQTSNFRESL